MTIQTAREVRHCEHIRNGSAQPYIRLVSGGAYDLIVCEQCYNTSAPVFTKIDEIRQKLNRIIAPRF